MGNILIKFARLTLLSAVCIFGVLGIHELAGEPQSVTKNNK